MLIETAREFFSYVSQLNLDPTSKVNFLLFDSYRMLETDPLIIKHLCRFYPQFAGMSQSHV